MMPLHDAQDVQLDLLDDEPEPAQAENGGDSEYGEILPNPPPGSYDPATVDLGF